METSDVLTLVTILLTIGGSVIGLIKWVVSNNETLLKNMETRTTELTRQIDNKITDISGAVHIRHRDCAESITNAHKRIDAFKDEIKDGYVKRVDLDRDLANMYGILHSIEAAQRDSIKEMNARIDSQTKEISSRLDRVLMALAGRNYIKNPLDSDH